MEVVIVRPPLVYGPGVKANFAVMMCWVARGIPLPLGALHNSRSIVALDNLVDLLVTCIQHPAAAGQTFLVSDGEDVSTTELLRRTAQAMGASRGAALSVLARLGVKVGEYAPTRIKLAVAGHGAAKKEQVGRMVRSVLGLATELALDESDAAAAALCHAFTARG